MSDHGRLAWSHNAWYHQLLLRRLPSGCGLVLDAGCGAGVFTARLVGHSGQVLAVDRSPAMVAAARTRAPSNVTVVEDDLLTVPLPDGGLDAIVSIAVLHHLPLAQALPRFTAALRPGGVLAAVALPRLDLPRDLPIELASVTGQMIVAVGRRAAPGASWSRRLDPGIDGKDMPIQPPQLTTTEVRRQAGALLPGARVTRLPFWRYLLHWQRPA